MVKKEISIIITIFLLSFCSFAVWADTIDTPEYILYMPSGIDSGQKYPLVIALSPNADAQGMINVWKAISEKYNWILFASKEFKNGQPFYSDVDYHIMAVVKQLCMQYPIDTSRIIATGMSGGGMGSHGYAFIFPEIISAIVVNTGKINEYFLEPGQKEKYPQGKIAVFLASPTDFRYQEMKRDQVFLENIGWKTKWIEFEGGHTFAPASAYGEAAEWLMKKLFPN